ncbi:MAG: hypothetical protein KC519_22045 [Anaerolineae bacterium]|nr:hypothetical protein [Anaerolineae bacterium]
MINRRDRIIGTLIVWGAMLMALVLFLQQFRSPGVNVWGNWYAYGTFVGSDPLEASRVIDALSNFSSNNYQTIQAFVTEQMRGYYPLLALLVLILIGTAVFSTYVIWRSVIIPDSAHELAEKRKSAARLEQAERNMRQPEAEPPDLLDESEIAATRKARS